MRGEASRETYLSMCMHVLPLGKPASGQHHDNRAAAGGVPPAEGSFHPVPYGYASPHPQSHSFREPLTHHLTQLPAVDRAQAQVLEAC